MAISAGVPCWKPLTGLTYGICLTLWSSVLTSSYLLFLSGSFAFASGHMGSAFS